MKKIITFFFLASITFANCNKEFTISFDYISYLDLSEEQVKQLKIAVQECEDNPYTSNSTSDLFNSYVHCGKDVLTKKQERRLKKLLDRF